MNKNCAFTICTNSYLPLAKILRKTFYENNTNVDFFIVLSDSEFDLDEEILSAKKACKFSDSEWFEQSFKYDVTEFCTFLKPNIFLSFLKKYREVLYFDPDIMFFNTIDNVYNLLEKKSVVVTPHICNIPEKISFPTGIEDELRGSGIFNFGFVGFANTKYANDFLIWWSKQLKDKCYRDSVSYMYTDQIWGNYLFSYLPVEEICVLRDLGYNIAPWNFSEREIYFKQNKIYVKLRGAENLHEDEVIFVHFSGFDYLDLLNSNICQKNKGHEYSNLADINEIVKIYSRELCAHREDLLSNFKNGYKYGSYSNGDRISLLHRRLYRMCLVYGINISNPFDVNNDFYKKIKRNKLLTISVNNSSSQLKTNNSSNKNALKIFDKVLYIIFRILGVNKYVSFLKLLKGLGLYENQLFLINKKEIHLWYRKNIL